MAALPVGHATPPGWRRSQWGLLRRAGVRGVRSQWGLLLRAGVRSQWGMRRHPPSGLDMLADACHRSLRATDARLRVLRAFSLDHRPTRYHGHHAELLG